jgi:hypothetical protein
MPDQNPYEEASAELDDPSAKLIFSELLETLRLAAVAHASALSGIDLFRDRIMTSVAQSPNPAASMKSDFILGVGPPEESGSIAYSQIAIAEIPTLMREGGPIATQISQQWAVTVHAEWDEHYRDRLTAALGEPEKLAWPPFGDLRHLRNDIVHNRGRASAERLRRMSVFTDWFGVDEPIFFDTRKVAEFMAAVNAEVWRV